MLCHVAVDSDAHVTHCCVMSCRIVSCQDVDVDVNVDMILMNR